MYHCCIKMSNNYNIWEVRVRKEVSEMQLNTTTNLKR